MPACPLCLTDSQLTNEDILPTWMRKRMIKLVPEFSAEARHKARVCGPCNGRLGAAFESKVARIMKPMVDGHEVRLAPQQQVLVAGWALKTNLVTRLAHRRVRTRHSDPLRAAYLRRTLDDLLRDGRPPANCLVRIGALDPRVGQPGSPPNPEPFPERLYRDSAYRGVTSFGFIVWQTVVGGPFVDVSDYIGATQHNDRFIRVWPQHPKRTQVWPPASVMTMGDVEALEMSMGNGPDLKVQQNVTRRSRRADESG